MSVSAKRWLAGVAWAAVAAMACAGPAWAADPWDANQSGAAKPADVSRLDFSLPSPEERGSGAAANPPAATRSIVEPARPATRLDFFPGDADAPDALTRSPLPPDAPPLPSSALLIPVESPPAPAPPDQPARAAPLAALASPPVEAPMPSEGLAASSPRASPLAALAPPPVELAAPERSAAAPADLAGAVDAASAALMMENVKANPLGSGDWRAARAAIRVVYAERAFAPVWTGEKGLTPAGLAVLRRLLRAPEDGVDLGGFTLPAPDFAESRPDKLAEAETALSAAAVVYALQASGSRIVPSRLSNFVTAKPVLPDPGEVLRDVARAADPGEALAAYNPGQKGYRDLRDELARLRESAAPVAGRSPAGPTLRVGMEDARVPLIRARFGLGAAADPAVSRVYDRRVATAVAAFQRMKGLAPDGALTTATEEALFGDPNARRESAIVANMEMWRWLPRDMGEARIEINVADFTLHVMNGAEEVRAARVIVGKPDTPTPIFSNEVRYILLNPIWRVPDSIVKKEMLPKLASDPDYLTRRGFQVTRAGDRLVVNQPPGEGNALGRILFMFPNEHAVYLHDTPSRGLFATSRRAYSHGCVRVEDPMELAELLMGGAARGWTARKFQSLLGSDERAVFLPKPLPIHIEYFTEFVDATGVAREREDVYGLTAQVAATLSRLRQD